ncbi:transglutaminase domain-containing protein [Candidatus Micrarchaeota archaeon]|nr:transglutaminase domain-containing protein [Candidatus Micrarchaeota archaeon]
MNKLISLPLAVFFILLLIPGAAAFQSPKSIGSTHLYVEVNWTLDSLGSLGPIELSGLNFIKSPYQSPAMEANRASTQATDSVGNNLLNFKFTASKPVETLFLRGYVDVNYLNAGLEDADEEQLGDYLKPSPFVQLTPAIADKAISLTEGIDDPLEKLVVLTEWVNNNVEYDGAGYGATIENSSWVFDNRRGTCDEFSHLLIAMLRSINIPSRFSAGFVCSSDCSDAKNWGPHAWVEAAIGGKWVPSDPTFAEAIILDATHAKFAQGFDQDNVKESYSGNIHFTRNFQVSMDSFGGFPDYYDISISVPSNEVGEKSVENVSVTVENKLKTPIAVPLSLIAPKEAKVIGGKKLVFLDAFESKTVFWEIAFPQVLEENLVYTYPIAVTGMGKDAQANITLRKGGDSTVRKGLQLNEVIPTIKGNSLELKLLLENIGSEQIAGNASFYSSASNFAIQPGSSQSFFLKIIFSPLEKF